MGGSGLYHPPVKNWTGIATWEMHTKRGTPSTEPGVDWYCPRFTDLHAAASGVVVGVFYGIGPATGRYISIDLDDGKRVRYLHLEEIYVTVGQRVAWGEVIGKTGATGYGEPDWSWNVAETGGSHVHQTVFPGHEYVFGRYATLDPWPLTDTSSASVAAAIQSEEDDDMLMLNITGLGIATPKVTLGPGVFGHFVPSDPVETVKNVARIQDDWQDITAAELPSFLRLWGCDLRIWDVRDGQFVVLDPFTGEVGAGKTWTASGAVRAAINGIKIPEVDPAPIVAAVDKAVKAGLESGEDAIAAAVAEALAAGIKIDATEIAKAVNDEHARRLRSQS